MDNLKLKHQVLGVLTNGCKSVHIQENSNSLPVELSVKTISDKLKEKPEKVRAVIYGMPEQDEVDLRHNGEVLFVSPGANTQKAYLTKKYIKQRDSEILAKLKDVVGVFSPVTALIISIFSLYFSTCSGKNKEIVQRIEAIETRQWELLYRERKDSQTKSNPKTYLVPIFPSVIE